ncbi:MAG: hypothetical protein ACYSTI_06140 [Planctomycetota bacterium]
MARRRYGHSDLRPEIDSYFDSLFQRAFKTGPFDFLCTIVRVGGMSDTNWDPFEESLGAFKDFRWLLRKTLSHRTKKAATRVALLIYCQAVEMTAVHEMLANLLRCVAEKPYVISAFGHLIKRKKKSAWKWVPPSAPMKFREIKRLASEIGDDQLSEIIEGFFNEDLRNAFSHSDYILTRTDFRWTEGGPAHAIPYKELDRLIAVCFDFYEAFIQTYKIWRLAACNMKRFHKWPRYEVLEILSNEKEGVFGFSIHFSNGQKATYKRQRSGVEATNIMFEQDSTINFFCGRLEKLEHVWKVDGVPITDWEAINKRS